MHDYLCLGPSPYEEDGVQVGAPDYRSQALAECTRYLQLLREKLGPEPAGAWLRVQWFPHDFGAYGEVVCAFTPDIEAAVAYARRCDEQAPATWEG